MFDSVPGPDVVRLTPPAEGFTRLHPAALFGHAASPGDALLRRRPRPCDAFVVRRVDADAGVWIDFDGPRPRAVRPGAEKGHPVAPRMAVARVYAADRRERAAAAARLGLVRADLQRRAHCLAVRRQRQRLLVDDHHGAAARGDADSARQQLRAWRGRSLCRQVMSPSRRSRGCFSRFSSDEGLAAARSPVVLVAGLLLVSARADAADRQIRPFIGATFGGGDDVRGSGESGRQAEPGDRCQRGVPG